MDGSALHIDSAVAGNIFAGALSGYAVSLFPDRLGRSENELLAAAA
jgi:hypothetical protein